MPYMEAAGIEPAQGSPGNRCVACPSHGAYLAELRSGMQAHVCGTCLLKNDRSWVYFITGGDHVKVGSSRNPVARLKGHQTGSPVPLEIAYLLEGPRLVEHFIHREARAFRAHGEWFRDCPEFWALIFSEAFRVELDHKRREIDDLVAERRVRELIEANR